MAGHSQSKTGVNALACRPSTSLARQVRRGWPRRADATDPAADKKHRDLMQVVGDDALRFGMAANATTVAALQDDAFKQGPIPQRLPLKQLFVEPQAD
jgi:hypothetical protein